MGNALSFPIVDMNVIADSDIENWMSRQALKGKRAQRRRNTKWRERRNFHFASSSGVICTEFVRPAAVPGHKPSEIVPMGSLRDYGQRPPCSQTSDYEWKTFSLIKYDAPSYEDQDFGYKNEETLDFSEGDFDPYDTVDVAVLSELIELHNLQDAFIAKYFPKKEDLADFCEWSPFGCDRCLQLFERLYPKRYALACAGGLI